MVEWYVVSVRTTSAVDLKFNIVHEIAHVLDWRNSGDLWAKAGLDHSILPLARLVSNTMVPQGTADVSASYERMADTFRFWGYGALDKYT
ncbi:MAG: hypothetical protein OIN84_03660, partial [Candidatus Methanoperedens sp.]|nr:hypothetical protein [Candidatus Methanoperedens sp.]